MTVLTEDRQVNESSSQTVRITADPTTYPQSQSTEDSFIKGHRVSLVHSPTSDFTRLYDLRPLSPCSASRCSEPRTCQDMGENPTGLQGSPFRIKCNQLGTLVGLTSEKGPGFKLSAPGTTTLFHSPAQALPLP